MNTTLYLLNSLQGGVVYGSLQFLRNMVEQAAMFCLINFLRIESAEGSSVLLLL